MTWEEDLPELEAHYGHAVEEERVATLARLEFLRTMEILARNLPRPPAVIADVGGGPGTYAFPLAAEGHVVHLLDPMPNHVARAQARSRSDTDEAELASAAVGHARALPWRDGTVDVCLFFGPMYHLTVPDERQEALGEVHRVLRPHGILMATAISRFAWMYVGLVRRFLVDPRFRQIAERDISDGQHRNPDRHPDWFTTAYCHRPEEFADEIDAAGFGVRSLLAVDGPAGLLSPDADLEWWLSDTDRRETLLAAIRRVEAEPSLLGASPQMLAVAQKKRVT